MAFFFVIKGSLLSVWHRIELVLCHEAPNASAWESEVFPLPPLTPYNSNAFHFAFLFMSPSIISLRILDIEIFFFVLAIS